MGTPHACRKRGRRASLPGWASLCHLAGELKYAEDIHRASPCLFPGGEARVLEGIQNTKHAGWKPHLRSRAGSPLTEEPLERMRSAAGGSRAVPRGLQPAHRRASPTRAVCGTAQQTGWETSPSASSRLGAVGRAGFVLLLTKSTRKAIGPEAAAEPCPPQTHTESRLQETRSPQRRGDRRPGEGTAIAAAGALLLRGQLGGGR